MTEWQAAPLFSAAGIETNSQARERATAALLAVTPLVPGFAAVGAACVEVEPLPLSEWQEQERSRPGARAPP